MSVKWGGREYVYAGLEDQDHLSAPEDERRGIAQLLVRIRQFEEQIAQVAVDPAFARKFARNYLRMRDDVLSVSVNMRVHPGTDVSGRPPRYRMSQDKLFATADLDELDV